MYSVDGVDQDWHYFAHGSIAYIVEGPYHNPGPQKYEASINCMLPIANRLIQRHIDAPRISGQVFSSTGEPLEATIAIDEVKLSNGENIICNVVSDTDRHIEIESPLKMETISRVTKTGIVESLSLGKWMQPFSDQKTISLNKNYAHICIY